MVSQRQNGVHGHVSMESRRYIQKSGLSKRFVDSKNSKVNDSIFLFVEKLYLDDPYYKMYTRALLR